jgi:hypothetical protein
MSLIGDLVKTLTTSRMIDRNLTGLYGDMRLQSGGPLCFVQPKIEV